MLDKDRWMHLSETPMYNKYKKDVIIIEFGIKVCTIDLD